MHSPREAQYLLIGNIDWARQFQDAYSARILNTSGVIATNVTDADRHMRRNSCAVIVFEATEANIEVANGYQQLLYWPGSRLDAIIVDNTERDYFGEVEVGRRVHLLVNREEIFTTMNSSLRHAFGGHAD